jgi:hypothetical protein
MEKHYKEVYSHWLPILLLTKGVTIGNTIYYKGSINSVPMELKRHERCHIEQYRKYGLVGFLAIYLLCYTKGRLKGKGHWKAYEDIPFEIEARKCEK